MPIIDKFKDMGTTVMGKVESGSVREGDSLLIMPNKVPACCLQFYACFPFYVIYLCHFMLKMTVWYIGMQAQVKVIAIFIDEDKVKRAGPGENLRVRLSGIDDEDILSGFVLSSVGK